MFLITTVAVLRRLVARCALASVTAALAAAAGPGTEGALSATTAPQHTGRAAAVFSPADEALLDALQRAAFQFFVEQSDPGTGLVRDRARADGSPSEGKASIAASGFALSAWAIGAERGWIDRRAAIERCRTALRFLATKAPRVHGFFYHFMDMRTGKRAWNCELSNIDTGLFLAGAITAREYFHDPEITALVDGLYHDVDWNWFLNGGTTFAIGWHEDAGFSRFRWMRYSELMMLTLLGLGAADHPIPAEAWAAWGRGPVGDYAGYHYIQYPSLFVHQFTHAYIDFRGLRDAYADYHRNSVLATLAQRQFCADLATEFPTWSTDLWGLTASDSATGYKGGWGGPPRTYDDIGLDGTLAPCAAAGSVTFTPEESMTVLHSMRSAYGDRIWKHYGFVDAFNPETGWVGPDVIGIDLGIELLQAENARTGFVTSVFMQAPEVRRGLARAGFLSSDRNLPAQDRARIRAVAADFWSAIDGAPLVPQTAGLQLSALVAARTLGLVPGNDANPRAAAMLKSLIAPTGDAAAVAQYAAGLVLMRQAFPSTAEEVARRLAAIDWNELRTASLQLGALERLAVFFQIATGAKPASAWSAQARIPEEVKPLFVLAPARVRDQLLPGLWLDERSIITGASAAQLAYAGAIAAGAPVKPALPDPLTAALWLEHFPAVAATALEAGPGSNWSTAAVGDKIAWLLSAANLLVPDSIRIMFQKDPLVKAGRAAIPDFAAAEFGPHNSVFCRHELAGPITVPPDRAAVAVAADQPRSAWRWVEIRGSEYRDSVADVHPGDPELAMRFAFTWDADALYFHADVIDGLPKITKPGKRNGVELFVDPANDGLVWSGDGSYQFTFRNDGSFGEAFHHRPVTAERHATADGYTLEARIAWVDLGVTPHPGLQIAISPAVVSESPYDWEPALKLNWRYYQRSDLRYGLGTLRLE
jgi:hypothetical protein